MIFVLHVCDLLIEGFVQESFKYDQKPHFLCHSVEIKMTTNRTQQKIYIYNL